MLYNPKDAFSPLNPFGVVAQMNRVHQELRAASDESDRKGVAFVKMLQGAGDDGKTVPLAGFTALPLQTSAVRTSVCKAPTLSVRELVREALAWVLAVIISLVLGVAALVGPLMLLSFVLGGYG